MNKSIASILLEIEAVMFKPDQPFTWSSGILSPIYCDNRLLMSYPNERRVVINAFSQMIQDTYPEAECLAATATAGIPHAAWLSEQLQLPMVYVRSGKKKHGKGNQIEGKLSKGTKVVVIEDLISTGGSAIETAEVLRDYGAEVSGIAAIFSYGLPKAKQNSEKHRIKMTTLTAYDELIEAAVSGEYIEAAELDSLRAWRKAPEKWA
ncbi:orotate phosphoribosyltransferase [Salisediminibacterium halotolerans]|uniref:Orotate phosphoribosyltransferase n=1 Tax=Salisediminibacterium halotolerans TaxID=517425 RepID=A0A1H9PX92_9BACI|nr:orotate phosphoribosyltransferase [Salisediminibacterium haloalkalitolerans]SER52738.1 orotate phosphoribosyltransferase [Salisediminibacterium haloalkalitolerans]